MADVTLLDGGMGQELIARHGRPPTPLWATQVMLEAPDLVRQVHGDYFTAGATVATTNSYALHHDRLERFGLDHRFAELHETALAQAEAARAGHGGGRIAGALGPLVGSYRPDAFPPHEDAVVKYTEIARIMAGRVDLILCETVASVAHARSVIEGAVEARVPVWLSVTVDDEDGTRLRSGERVAEIAPLLGPVAAVLANCSAPEAMDQAMPVLAGMGRPFGAYANGFQRITKEFLGQDATVEALKNRPEMTPARYAEFVMGWVDRGATIVGGCCETGPAHIAEIARRLRQAGHRIV